MSLSGARRRVNSYLVTGIFTEDQALLAYRAIIAAACH
jgi:hypothetical protein